MTTDGGRSAPATSPATRSLLDAVREAVGTAGAATVFGDPINRGDTTVIPVARVHGRGGGGGGGAALDHPGGSGAGMTLSAKPVGAYVMTDGRVRWRPAVDVTTVILGGQAVAVAATLITQALRRRHGAAGRLAQTPHLIGMMPMGGLARAARMGRMAPVGRIARMLPLGRLARTALPGAAARMAKSAKPHGPHRLRRLRHLIG
jgi:uncharacterized spore protein YtfJ